VPDPASHNLRSTPEGSTSNCNQPCRIVNVPPMSNHRRTLACVVASDRHWRQEVLLRKEVIQPHLPVRLPCYDFVPIASPTFDDSLPHGLGHRLRVLPTFVT
jgi:hypothetical protein